MTENSRPNPYVGPRAFQTGEKLYGRDSEAGMLLDLLIAERIVLLHSPSGAGKSSLVQAGLIPRLEAEGFRVLPPIRVNLEPPLELQSIPGFNRYAYSALVSLEEAFQDQQATPPEDLAGMTLDSYLERCMPVSFVEESHQQHIVAEENTASASSQPSDLITFEPSNLVIIFDQFEEILTVAPNDREGKLAFFNQVGAALRRRNRWGLFVMREDYIAALDPYLRPLPTRLSSTFRLDYLGKEAAGQAIQRPAREAGVNFQDEARQKLVDDLRRVQVQRPDGSMEDELGLYVEPVQLQVVCYRLWDHLPEGATEIRTSDIISVGDVDQALADYYADRAAAAADQTGASERKIRDWFEHQLITPGGIRSQVLMGQGQSGGLDNQAIRFLENAHLVRGEKRGGAIWFELAHDRLISPVRKNNAAWFATHLNLFQRQATLWNSENRPESLLLREKELAEAEAWAEAHSGELTEAERAFLESCQELRQRELEARQLEEAQKTAETERKRAEDQARAARRIRRLARVIAVLGVIALLAAVLASVFWQRSSQTAIANAGLAATNATIAAVNAVFASTNQAAASTAQSASTLAIDQKFKAELASTQENIQRLTAQAASTLAIDQQVTAEWNAQVAQKNAEESRANAAEADRQAGIAFSRQLASQADSYLGPQLDLGLLLGIEAYRASDTLEAQSAILTGLAIGLNRTIDPYGRPVQAEQVSLTSVAVSPDGERLAFGNANGEVVIWNYQQGKVENRFKDHIGIVWSLAFNPDGNTLASSGDDRTIWLRDVFKDNSSKLLLPGKVLSISWNPEGTHLAAATGPRIIVWDPFNTQALVINKNLQFEMNCVAWSPDGTKLAAGSTDNQVYVLDSNSGEVQMALPGHGDKVTSVAWAPDSKVLASGSNDHTVRLWDVQEQAALGDPLEEHSLEVLSLAFSYDGSLLASGGADDNLIVWDVASRSVMDVIDVPESNVTGVAFLQKGGPAILAASSYDKTVRLFQVSQQQPLSNAIASDRGRVLGLALNSDNELLAASIPLYLTVWNQPKGIQVAEVRDIPDIAGAALSRDGQIMAVSDEAGMIRFRDARSGAPVHAEIQAGEGPVYALAFSPDGSLLASGSCAQPSTEDPALCLGSEIRIWDVASGASKGDPIQAHADFIYSLAFNPDGSLLASGGGDNSIFLWDLKTGNQVGLPLLRHRDRVTALAFSQDGNTLASGSFDRSLILWSVPTGQIIGIPFTGSEGDLLSLVFNPDEKAIFSGGSDGKILRWDINPESWVERACNMALRNLTSSEWDQFLGSNGETLHQTCPAFPLDSPAPDQEAQPTPTPTPTSTPTP